MPIYSTLNFQIPAEDLPELYKWMTKQDKKSAKLQRQQSGAITGNVGGSYTYSFTPTGIGLAIRVKNAVTGDIIDLSHYETW